MKSLFISAAVSAIILSTPNVAAACDEPIDCFEKALKVLEARNSQIDQMNVTIQKLTGTIADMEAAFEKSVIGFTTRKCPEGWSEYKIAYGRFLRGIDPQDARPRRPGSTQEESIKNHSHHVQGQGSVKHAQDDGGSWFAGLAATHQTGDYRELTEGFGGDETRPANVAVLFCQKD